MEDANKIQREAEQRNGTSKTLGRIEGWHGLSRKKLLESYKRTEIGFGHMATVPTKFEADQATGVSAAVRYRESWDMRMLTLSGPPDSLTEARRMAMARIAASQTRQRQTRQQQAQARQQEAQTRPKLLNPEGFGDFRFSGVAGFGSGPSLRVSPASSFRVWGFRVLGFGVLGFRVLALFWGFRV